MDAEQQAIPGAGISTGLGATNHWAAPPSTAPGASGGSSRRSDEAARTPRRWQALAFTAVLAGLAGGTAGFFVADDADHVADLEAEIAAAEDETEELEDDLQREQDLRSTEADRLEDCRDLAGVSVTLVERVGELEAADAQLMATTPGSAAETAAGSRLAAAYIALVRASSAVELAAGTCLADDAD